MEEIEKLKFVNKWQSCDMVHPLTCYEHHNLTPKINDDDKCVLICPICKDYIQEFIPSVVFNVDEMIEQGKQMKELFDRAKNQQREKDSQF